MPLDSDKATLPCVCSLCDVDCKDTPHLHPLDQKRNIELVICGECIGKMALSIVGQMVRNERVAAERAAKAKMN